MASFAKNTKPALLGLIGILFLFLISTLWRLNYPPLPYFDEVYHLPAARLVAENDPRAYEWWHQPIAGDDYHDWLHPPLVKVIQAISINWLGDSGWGWRVPSVLAGALLLLALYFFSKQVFSLLPTRHPPHHPALLSSLLFTVSGLSLAQSRIAMNDIFVTLWMILALLSISLWQSKLWLFKLEKFAKQPKQLLQNQNKYLLLTGLMLGLAIASKWSAVLLLIFLLVLVSGLIIKNKMFKILPLVVFSLLVLPATVYLASYSQMFAQGKSVEYFVEIHQQIIWYQTHRDADHRYHSKPQHWLLNTGPVWYWGERLQQQGEADAAEHEFVANIYALGNPVLYLMITFTLVYRLATVCKNMKTRSKSTLQLSLILLFLALWLPWFFAPRIVFFHLFLPASAILIMMLAELLLQLKQRSLTWFWSLLSLILLSFVIFYPHWTGLPVPSGWAEQVYFAFPSWR